MCYCRISTAALILQCYRSNYNPESTDHILVSMLSMFCFFSPLEQVCEKYSDMQDQLVQTAVLKTVFHGQTVEERDLRMNDRLDQ